MTTPTSPTPPLPTRPATATVQPVATHPPAPPAIHPPPALPAAPPSTAPLQGKKRGFGRGLALTIVTLGLYAIYWHYKVYEEFRRQHRAGEEFPTLWFILALIPLVGIIGELIYMSKFLDLKNGIRQQLGMAPGMTLGTFLLWFVLGSLIIIGPFVAYYKLQGDINEVWDRSMHPPGAHPPATFAAPRAASP